MPCPPCVKCTPWYAFSARSGRDVTLGAWVRPSIIEQEAKRKGGPTNASQWQAFYKAGPGGRFTITTPALIAFEMMHRKRILDTFLRGWIAKVLLLDKPMELSDPAPSEGEDEPAEFFLRKVPLRDLPGWPPKMAGPIPELECLLREVILTPGAAPIQDALVLILEWQGRRFPARFDGCPPDLLRCAGATLRQEGAVGRRLLDLQSMRLIGEE